MVTLGSHYMRVWDVDEYGRILPADSPRHTALAMRSVGREYELADAHTTFEGISVSYVVPYNDVYYVTMAAEVRIPNDYNWQLHTIQNVQHEALAGYTTLTLEIRQGQVSTTRREFGPGFSSAFA